MTIEYRHDELSHTNEKITGREDKEIGAGCGGISHPHLVRKKGDNNKYDRQPHPQVAVKSNQLSGLAVVDVIHLKTLAV